MSTNLTLSKGGISKLISIDNEVTFWKASAK